MASRLRSSLQKLVDHGVDFIAIRDLAAALHGAPLLTVDFAVVVSDLCQAVPNDLGVLRILRSAGRGRTYRDLLPTSTVIEISPDLRVRVVNLETDIALREESGSLVDLAILPTLQATLAEIRRQSAASTTSECG